MKGLENQLTNRDITPTAMRMLVLEVLQKSEIALSLSDLEIELEHADKATIYRTLKKFEEHKLIHSIEDGTGSLKYALCESNCQCTPEFSHAHFRCNRCNQTFCLRNYTLPELSLPKNFLAEQTSFVVKGICDNCY